MKTIKLKILQSDSAILPLKQDKFYPLQAQSFKTVRPRSELLSPEFINFNLKTSIFIVNSKTRWNLKEFSRSIAKLPLSLPSQTKGLNASEPKRDEQFEQLHNYQSLYENSSMFASTLDFQNSSFLVFW